MFTKILTIVMCFSVIALFSPLVDSSLVHAAGEKCQCQGDVPCRCGADCKCDHCKPGTGCPCGAGCQCEHCKTGKGQCQCKAGENGCVCGKGCDCEHCKTGKGSCSCRTESKGCQCGAGCQCEHCKTGKGQCQCKAGEKGCACGKKCAGEHCKTGKRPYQCQTKCKNTAPAASSQMTAASLFQVSYKTAPTPIPMNAFHAWTLTVQTADGKPVTDAEILVSGGMPAHGHGLQAKPTVKNLGNGQYLIEGVKFFMPGQWEMNFTIKSSGKEDTISFTTGM